MPEISFEISPADRPVLEKILASSGYFYDFEIEVALDRKSTRLNSSH